MPDQAVKTDAHPLPVSSGNDAPMHRPAPGVQDSNIIDGLSRALFSDVKQGPGEFGRTNQQDHKRLLAVTRIVNAYYNYLSSVCNRPLDEITPSDVTRLGLILKTVEESEHQDRIRRNP
ncbi:hypothetical protein ABEG18_25495 [Alsobacter sp. KACC 23698]|uniref:Uncharacterized protein n=1 Tax=Alsobacter sp. KACC 23698 TaxID=3149229 RepID=A0AAU7JFD1_9HYPH